MCGCGAKSSMVVASIGPFITSNEDCPYTNEILLGFKNNLIWFKNSGLYLDYNISIVTLNKHIGITISSINIGNKCEYESALNEVNELNNFIITLI